MNDGNIEESCSACYSIFNDAVHLARLVGYSAMMAKIDVKHHRLRPVRIVDRQRLCIQWDNCYFVDTHLLFGCRTSPAIFNTFADALVSCGGIHYRVHYLDDFFMRARYGNMLTVDGHFLRYWLFPVGPSSQITYLGIEIDTVAHCIMLPRRNTLR